MAERPPAGGRAALAAAVRAHHARLDAEERFVSSQAGSGSSQVPTGTYRGVNVNADGSWTIRITPNR